MNNVKVIGIFPVAGFGFRFSGEDNQLQKPFVNIFGRSQIEWSVLYAKKNFPDLPITIAHRTGLKNEFMNFALHMRNNYKVILDLIDVLLNSSLHLLGDYLLIEHSVTVPPPKVS